MNSFLVITIANANGNANERKNTQQDEGAYVNTVQYSTMHFSKNKQKVLPFLL